MARRVEDPGSVDRSQRMYRGRKGGAVSPPTHYTSVVIDPQAAGAVREQLPAARLTQEGVAMERGRVHFGNSPNRSASSLIVS